MPNFEQFCRQTQIGWMISRFSWPVRTRTMASVGLNGRPTLRHVSLAHLQDWTVRFAAEIDVIKYWQFEFFQQWQVLRSYAHAHGVRIIGDIPYLCCP